MSERLKYVSPEYQARLDALAKRLCTPERFGKHAVGQMVLVFESDMGNTSVQDSLLEDTVEFPAIEG